VQIDRESQSKTIVFWKVTTTLTLVDCDGSFGVNYAATFRGQTYSGGPFPVSGNGSWKAHQNPDINVTISNWSKTSSTIAFRVVIVVDKSGSHTIFDGTLSGDLPQRGELEERIARGFDHV
jgi:hypothetical protein